MKYAHFAEQHNRDARAFALINLSTKRHEQRFYVAPCDGALISYHRGIITVLDRAGLEERVCECYAVVKEEYDRLLSHYNVAT